MATVKNEVFIGLSHEHFYLVGRKEIDGRRNCSKCKVNVQNLASGGINPYLPVAKALLIYIYIYNIIYIMYIYIYLSLFVLVYYVYII